MGEFAALIPFCFLFIWMATAAPRQDPPSERNSTDDRKLMYALTAFNVVLSFSAVFFCWWLVTRANRWELPQDDVIRVPKAIQVPDVRDLNDQQDELDTGGFR